MRDRLAERVRQFRATARPILSNGWVVLVLLMLTVGAVGAQTVTIYEGDFEDGTTEDWSGGTVVQENNENMLWANAADANEAITIPGSSFNGSNFIFTATIWSTTTDGAYNLRIDGTELRIEISWQNDNVILFSGGEINSASGTLPTNEYINVTFKGNETGTYAFVENLGWTSGPVSTATGEASQYDLGWEVYTAEYEFAENASTIPEETVADDKELKIDSRDYLKPNTSVPYSVHFNDSGNVTDVTDQATVTSNNTSVLSVNQSAHLFEGQPGVNTTVNVTAEYTDANGTVYNTTKQITVAQATVENLEILPAIWRFGATFGDDTIFFLIVATLTSIVATRFSTAFGGLSLYWVVIMLGWFSGWVSVGILMLATVMCMFIGLNLAANIDYGAAGRLRR